MRMNFPYEAQIRFYAELNDFLPPARKQQNIPYEFSGRPGIKDVIEALGVPHPEVDLILVNGNSVDFSYHLKSGDRVAVYPVFELLDVTNITRLRPRPLRRPKFIADVNLGRLTRKLRMLGFSTLYSNHHTDEQIIDLSLSEQRTILTRDIGLLKHAAVSRGYWVRSQNAFEQTCEVIKKYDLYGSVKPFSRCLDCDGEIQPVDKKNIEQRLQPKARQHFTEFFQCASCGKIYWKGSHYERMLAFINKIKQCGKN